MKTAENPVYPQTLLCNVQKKKKKKIFILHFGHGVDCGVSDKGNIYLCQMLYLTFLKFAQR